MESAKDVLKNFFKKYDIFKDKNEDKKQFIIENWDKILNDNISKQIKPFRFSKNILFIYVENSVIMNEVIYKKEEIKNKINSVFKENLIKEIIFRLKK